MAAAPLRRALGEGASLQRLLPVLLDWLAGFPGHIGACLRAARRPLRARLAGLAVHEVFPLPPLVLQKRRGVDSAPVLDFASLRNRSSTYGWLC